MKYLISFIALFISFSTCNAQQAGERITKSAVVIFNNSNQDKYILLGETLAKADTFKIRKTEVWISPALKANPLIAIQTDTVVKTYQLKLGNYYMIYWNQRKKAWDIKRTIKRQ